ncbi:hypothetical protein SASPL_151127 [Salvia splendens]|uniref:Protein root UVB sensitive/RUS domain-containing protein n=1 Tax=Salvia splendens TaxID=180675 RepID=A0A8X8W7B0_SALSN|nr:protein root UVB sensitive 1, chloroplastic-like [Salvia splendens]KAG6389655.1 hypothetical protein SASPL_151127 [Salvia splendens]
MGCSACNPFPLLRQPSSPSTPPTATSAASFTLSIAFPFPSHRTGERTILHLNHNRFTPLHYSSRPLHKGGVNGGGSSGGGGNGRSGDDGSGNSFNFNRNSLFLLPWHLIFSNREESRSVSRALLFSIASYFILSSSPARAENGDNDDSVYEIKGGKRIELLTDYSRDEFVVHEKVLFWPWRSSDGNPTSSAATLGDVWAKCRDLAAGLLLPEGFPDSVTSDYLEYSLWRGVQGIAAQISGVLATQAMLYAIGLGKGAIPTAAAVNWVLKDGIGYISKIMLSKYGRHFDVNPKGWRLFADLLENAAFGMEILTPAFPHLFVPIGALAGAGRSAGALIQAATRSCFYAGFAAQRNFAEVIAKGEAQGMVSKSIGIMLGIVLANAVQSSTPLALASFGVITWVHVFCNLKSYQSIQIRTLNPYRASLLFSEYLLSGLVPSVREVNDEEPLFPAFPLLIVKPTSEEQLDLLSTDAKDAAAQIDRRLQLGSKPSEFLKNREDAVALFDLYKDEAYILTELEGKYCVALKESSSPQDMLRSLYHVCYLYWLEKNAGIKSSSIVDDCRAGGKLQISLEYVQREFNHVKKDSEVVGWVLDGLIARPLPNRVQVGNGTTSSAASSG